MMHQPVGAKHSPSHHEMVLANWANQSGLRLGVEGSAGYALFVRKVGNLHAFIVEGRGPNAHPIHVEYTYLAGGRWRGSQFSRAAAFRKAIDLFRRLTRPADDHQGPNA